MRPPRDDGYRNAMRIRFVKAGLPWLVILLLARVLVLKYLWNWYVPHVLHQASHIGFAAAAGLILILMLFKGLGSGEVDPESRWRALRGLQVNIASCLVIFLIGFLIHQFFV